MVEVLCSRLEVNLIVILVVLKDKSQELATVCPTNTGYQSQGRVTSQQSQHLNFGILEIELSQVAHLVSWYILLCALFPHRNNNKKIVFVKKNLEAPSLLSIFFPA